MIYIHGGMNFIAKTGPFDGSTEKAVALTPLLLREHIYPIFICWNSNLFDTYRENLLFVREGLRQTGRGLATAPFQLVADFGGAAARAPLALSKLFFNDLYYLNPEGTRRRRIADARYDAMYQAGLSPDYTGVQTSVGADQRGTGRKAQDFLSWLAWLPNKAAVTPIIDGLGSPAWHNMLRRTRVMLDRESSFVQLLPAAERDACPAPGGVLKAQKQLAWSGREGAVRFFFESARDQLPAAGPLQPYYPRVTLIGHSMGAIIASDILTRVPDIHYENVVFMAAASSVNDFKLKVVPYLQNQQRKGSPTKFYNLCLNDANESGEREPSDFLEIAPRGSLLIWIDSLFDNPRDEDDRMLGRWENAILATDYVPDSIAKNVTIKAFGRDRHGSGPGYGLPARNAQGELEEPRKHGEFSRNQPTLAAGGAISDDGTPGNPNYPFWLEKYWKVEPESAAGDVLYHPKAGSRGR
jgi:pimeloyl-ACP methyl ester carboxylesterase